MLKKKKKTHMFYIIKPSVQDPIVKRLKKES